MKVVLTKAQKFHDDIREKIQSLGYEIIDHGAETEEFTAEEYGCDVLVGLDPFKGSDPDKFTNLRLFQALPRDMRRYRWKNSDKMELCSATRGTYTAFRYPSSP